MILMGGAWIVGGAVDVVDLRQCIREETSSITNCILKCFSLLFRKVWIEVGLMKGSSVTANVSLTFDN